MRFAATGHGDVRSLKDRPGELRLRVGKMAGFFSALSHLTSSAFSVSTKGVKLTDPQPASCLKVVVRVRPTDGRVWNSLAVARAASGNKGKALAALKIAASHGFHDVAAMDRELLLNSVRRDPKYASLVHAMNPQPPPARYRGGGTSAIHENNRPTPGVANRALRACHLPNDVDRTYQDLSLG